MRDSCLILHPDMILRLYPVWFTKECVILYGMFTYLFHETLVDMRVYTEKCLIQK